MKDIQEILIELTNKKMETDKLLSFLNKNKDKLSLPLPELKALIEQNDLHIPKDIYDYWIQTDKEMRK